MRAGEWVFPDFLNLGLAPRKNFAPAEVAPRAALRPIGTYGDAFTRIPRAFTPQPLYTYLLPQGLLYQGPAFQAPFNSQLLPNPYTGG